MVGWIHNLSDITDGLAQRDWSGGGLITFTQGDGVALVTSEDDNASANTLMATLPNPEYWTTDNDITIKGKVKLNNYTDARFGFGIYAVTNSYLTEGGNPRRILLAWTSDLYPQSPAFSFHTCIDFSPTVYNRNDVTIGTVAHANDWADTWIWFKMVLGADGVATGWMDDSGSETEPETYNTFMGINSELDLTDIIRVGLTSLHSNDDTLVTWDHFSIESDLIVSGIVGMDESINFSSYYLRTALNGGGNATIITPSPFFTPVTPSLFRDQLKKQLTYTNDFGTIQWQGETTTLKLGIHGAVFEAEEMIRKTMFTEVGDTPIIFSSFIRQVQGLQIVDKDADFVNRGVTTNHFVSFEKADKKVFEARSDSDTFGIFEDNFVTPFVPSVVSNDKDEEMYYKDAWDSVDTDRAHIVLNSTGDDPYVVRYPINIYEKFNNLNKLNKLEFEITVSAVRTDDGNKWTSASGSAAKYKVFMYNYHMLVFEEIKQLGKDELKTSNSTLSTVDPNVRYYDPVAMTINVDNEIKGSYDEWNTGTTYDIGDRAVKDNILYTSITNNNTNNDPLDIVNWQRTVYDFVDYESTATEDDDFSKLTSIFALMTTSGLQILRHGFWLWSLSTKATFDEDNEPEFSTASIATVAADGKSITLNATSGVNLPYEDGFGVGDVMHITKSAEDYLQDTWDASTISSDLGALNLNIAGGSTTSVTEDFTYKSFFDLMQHISELTNSTFWADYDTISTIEMVSAGNHDSSGIILRKDDIDGYNQGNWSITYDAAKQRNKLRIIGDNVNFIKTLLPTLDPFDLGDETEIIEDSSIQTRLQASDLANKMAPRMENNEVIVTLVLNFSNPNQSFTEIEVGKTIALQLPDSTDTSICNFINGVGEDGELLIAAMEVNRNTQTGDQEQVTLMLQRRYS